jgi:hypothetical protein
MRRIKLFLPPLLLVSMACRHPEAVGPKPMPILPVTTTQDATAPSWIDNLEPFTAVGIEDPNPIGDLAFQRTAAIANGRTTLARDVETRARSLFQQLGQTSLAVGEKLRSVNGQRAQEEIIRQVTDVPLTGTQARRFWTQPGTGRLFVLVVADPVQAQNGVRTMVRQGLADLGAGQGDLQEAQERMETIFNASSKGPR